MENEVNIAQEKEASPGIEQNKTKLFILKHSWRRGFDSRDYSFA